MSNNCDEALGNSVMALGHRTNYHDEGNGQPVILLHGSGPGVSAWSNWATTMPALAEQHRVIAPDIAGFGLTEIKEGVKYNIKFWVQHLMALMDALDIEKASLVGNSFGGALSIAMALSHPERVERIILMGTPCGDFQITDGLRCALEYQPSHENMENLLALFPYNKDLITPQLVDSRYQASTRPGAHEAFQSLMPAPKDGTKTIVKGFPAHTLESITCNALVIHGREDQVVPPTCAEKIFKAIPCAQLHMFGQCGHWVQIEKQQQFLKLLSDFLSE